MRCHGCGAEVEIGSGESLGFRAECDACGRDLHVCLNCAHHDPNAYNECRESSAERVADRDRANRCDYFRLGSGAFRPESGASGASGDDERAKAKSALDALFKD